MNMTEAFQALLAVAATITAVTALVRRAVETKVVLPVIVWPCFAFVVGLAYCVGWHVNLAPLFTGLVPVLTEHETDLSGVAGEVMTGLAAGALAGFLHDTFDFIRAKTDESEARTNNE